MIDRALEKGGEAFASEYRARYPEEEGWSDFRAYSLSVRVSDDIRVWIKNPDIKSVSLAEREVIATYYRACPRFAGLLESGDVVTLVTEIERYRDLYEANFDVEMQMEGYFAQNEYEEFDFGGVCLIDFSSVKLGAALQILAPVADAIQRYDDVAHSAFGREFKLCGDARDGMRVSTSTCEAIRDAFLERTKLVSLHRASANVLRQAFDLSGRQDGKSICLSGLAYRRVGDYEPFVEAMKLYSDTFPGGPLADDALTEIGWFHLAVRQDPETADRWFQRVLDEYPESNAYDNALNWLVISRRMEGDYATALLLSARLMQTVASDRLFPKAAARHEELRVVAGLVDGREPVLLGENYETPIGFAMDETAEVRVAASSVADLPPESVITGLEGQASVDVRDFLGKLDLRRSQSADTVAIDIRLPDWTTRGLTAPIGHFLALDAIAKTRPPVPR